MSTIFLLLVSLIFTSTTLISFSSACNPLDKAALLAFKNSFPANAFPDWNESDDCCFWTGVRCKDSNGRVRYLVLTHKYNANVSGTIPPSIGDLTFLEILTFSNLPNLVGRLPPQFAKLTKLQYFDAYTTGLSGHIPSYLSKFTNLIELHLNDCKFKGPIPPSLATLTKLSFVSLTGNKLTGTIPPLFSKGTKYSNINLDLSNNKLTGPIPPSFGSVTFISINLSNNELTGDASFLFGESKQVFDIYLDHNQLSFDLTHVEYPQNLSFLDLSHNQIYGNISPQINNSSLGLVDFSYNQLCGQLPPFKDEIINQNDASKFDHNKCLCGKPLPPCK